MAITDLAYNVQVAFSHLSLQDNVGKIAAYLTWLRQDAQDSGAGGDSLSLPSLTCQRSHQKCCDYRAGTGSSSISLCIQSPFHLS